MNKDAAPVFCINRHHRSDVDDRSGSGNWLAIPEPSKNMSKILTCLTWLDNQSMIEVFSNKELLKYIRVSQQLMTNLLYGLGN